MGSGSYPFSDTSQATGGNWIWGRVNGRSKKTQKWSVDEAWGQGGDQGEVARRKLGVS